MAPQSLLPVLFQAPDVGGWKRGMAAVTATLLADLEPPPGPILEIGCGGGQTLSLWARRYPGRPLLGLDLAAQALAHVQGDATLPSHAKLIQADLTHLPLAAGSVALAAALDVFDQVGVTLDRALAESRRVLAPGGLLIVRVSAHPQLSGAHDAAFHTGRRYRRRELVAALDAQGFRLHRLTYANTLLGAPVAALRLAQRTRLLPWSPSLYTAPWANAGVALALRAEARLLRHTDLPIGLSLWAIAQAR
jgi:SAM-dependent methyltransferase